MQKFTDGFDPKNSLVYLTQKTFVFNEEGKFLTLLRGATAPTRPLKWDLPGGAYEVGEVPEEAAIREIKEESGLDVKDIQPVGLVGRQNEEKEYWVTVVYRANAVTTEVTLSFEHTEYKWVTKDEFLELDSSDKWRHITRTYLKD